MTNMPLQWAYFGKVNADSGRFSKTTATASAPATTVTNGPCTAVPIVSPSVDGLCAMFCVCWCWCGVILLKYNSITHQSSIKLDIFERIQMCWYVWYLWYLSAVPPLSPIIKLPYNMSPPHHACACAAPRCQPARSCSRHRSRRSRPRMIIRRKKQQQLLASTTCHWLCYNIRNSSTFWHLQRPRTSYDLIRKPGIPGWYLSDSGWTRSSMIIAALTMAAGRRFEMRCCERRQRRWPHNRGWYSQRSSVIGPNRHRFAHVAQSCITNAQQSTSYI